MKIIMTLLAVLSITHALGQELELQKLNELRLIRNPSEMRNTYSGLGNDENLYLSLNDLCSGDCEYFKFFGFSNRGFNLTIKVEEGNMYALNPSKSLEIATSDLGVLPKGTNRTPKNKSIRLPFSVINTVLSGFNEEHSKYSEEDEADLENSKHRWIKLIFSQQPAMFGEDTELYTFIIHLPSNSRIKNKVSEKTSERISSYDQGETNAPEYYLYVSSDKDSLKGLPIGAKTQRRVLIKDDQREGKVNASLDFTVRAGDFEDQMKMSVSSSGWFTEAFERAREELQIEMDRQKVLIELREELKTCQEDEGKLQIENGGLTKEIQKLRQRIQYLSHGAEEKAEKLEIENEAKDKKISELELKIEELQKELLQCKNKDSKVDQEVRFNSSEKPSVTLPVIEKKQKGMQSKIR